jgi:hypothetical protein
VLAGEIATTLDYVRKEPKILPPEQLPLPSTHLFSSAQYDPTGKLETPCNAELVNSTRYQIRVYGTPAGQSFSTAAVQAGNWSAATRAGFFMNFEYIEGANNHATKIPMTAPVVTRTQDEKNWLVSFFTPQSIYPSIAEAPVPTDPSVNLEAMPLTAFAVVEFGGEANEFDYKLASGLLRDALVADKVTIAPRTDAWAEAWCGYDAPNDVFSEWKWATRALAST